MWFEFEPNKKPKFNLNQFKCVKKGIICNLAQIWMKEFVVFPGKLYFLKFSLCSHIPLGFCSSKWWKENIGPLSCEPPHLHFNGSSFKFWESSNNPGTFSQFLQRSGAKRSSSRRKKDDMHNHAFPPEENLSFSALKMLYWKCFYKWNWIPNEGLAGGAGAELNRNSKLTSCWSNHILSAVNTWSIKHIDWIIITTIK